MSKRNLPLPIDVSCRISHWTATSLNLGDATSSEQALVSASTGIDSEADVTAFAATEAHFLSANNCEKKLNILEEGGTVNTDLMKKILLNYYIGLLLTLETDNLCTALLVRDLLPGVWLAVAGISFSSLFIVRLRASGNALGRWGWIVGTEPVFKLLLLEPLFDHTIILETFVCKMSASLHV